MTLLHSPLLLALGAQVALTVFVWIIVFVTRLFSMLRNRVSMQELATAKGYAKIGDVENISENLVNLFEVPILFYALVPILLFTDTADTHQVILAWIFVAGRALHSLIHITFNHIGFRFVAYLISSIALFSMWGLFLIQLISLNG